MLNGKQLHFTYLAVKVLSGYISHWGYLEWHASAFGIVSACLAGGGDFLPVEGKETSLRIAICELPSWSKAKEMNASIELKNPMQIGRKYNVYFRTYISRGFEAGKRQGG